MSIAAVSNGYGFQSSDVKGEGTDYAQALQKKYSYCNSSASINGVQTSVSVSSPFLEKCAKDPEILKDMQNWIPEKICTDEAIRKAIEQFMEE